MTTYPPLVFSNATISVDTTFTPQAKRDVDTPDIGFHYDSLDFAFGGTDANANITFAPGTAVGWFRTSSDWFHAGHGIHVGDGKTVTFDGRVDVPDYWVRASVVQEGGNGNWNGGFGPGGLSGWAWPDFAQAPRVSARFTRFSALGNDAMHMRDDWGYLLVSARDCEFWGGSLGGYVSQLVYTNCLFDRVSLWTFWDGIPVTNCFLLQQNCLMRGGLLAPSRSAPASAPQRLASR